jgi:hypothetical protein
MLCASILASLWSISQDSAMLEAILGDFVLVAALVALVALTRKAED